MPGHRHKDSRLKWTTTDTELEIPHPADSLTAAEVTAIKRLIAGGGGGTTPIPNPPPTPPPDITAPVISGVTVSAVTTTGATISWTTNEAATGLVEYGTTTAYGTSTAATSSGTTHSRNLTGLTPGQTYQFRVRSTDTAGNLGLDGNRTLTTAASVTLPGAPTGLTATGGSTQATLNWTAPASNGGSAITGYRVYRNGASLIVLGVVTTYLNTGLTNGLTYTYTVAAITAVGEGPQSNTASVTPSAGGDINAPVPTNIAAGSITTTSVQISWTQLEAGTGQVEYGLTTGYGTLSTLEAGYLTAHNQTLSGLLPNKLYHYRVRTRDAANNLGLSSDRTFTTLDTTPTPSPGRPFAAPTITNQVTVNAGANVQAVVDAAPNGTQFNFAAGATFTMANGIYLQNRLRLAFEGNGAEIRCTNGGANTAASMFKLDNGNSDIAIRNFTLRGSNPSTSTLYTAGQEYQMGVVIFDGIRIEIDNCNVRSVYGDGVYVAGKNSAPQRPSDQVWVHDSTFDYIGRMGMVWNAAENSITERCTWDHIGLFVLDLESDEDYEVIDTVYFRNNTVGSYGHSPTYSNFFFACSGNQAVATVDNVYITGNVVNQGAPINSPNNSTAKGGLQTIVSRGNRLTNIVFTGNSTTKSGVGPVLVIERVDGLTVTGNTQPLVSGSLGSYSDCTGATTSPNP